MRWLLVGLLLTTGCGALGADIGTEIERVFADINGIVVADAEQAIRLAQRATDQGPPAPATRLACYQAVLAQAKTRPAAATLPKGILSAAELYFGGSNSPGAGISNLVPIAIHDACAPLVLTVLQRGARRGIGAFVGPLLSP